MEESIPGTGIIKDVPDKLYSGAIANYPDNDEEGNRDLMQKVVASRNYTNTVGFQKA
jgi:hypothetical protein